MLLRPARWNNPDEESDLTELSSDEEDELEDQVQQQQPPPLPTPSTPSRRRTPPPAKSTERAKSTRPSTQQATQQSRARKDRSNETQASLKEAQYLTHPVYYLVELVKKGRIDVNPEYQRGVVWNENKQGAFIDSLIHNYHAPSIVLAKSANHEGISVWRCIDGKQRLTSLYRFCHGEIPYKDSSTNKKYWFTNPSGQRRRLIPPVTKSKLEEKRIAIDEYTEITEEQERAVFQRVQLGVVLGPADRLPAINGPNADLVRDVRRRINTTEGFEGYLDWGKARGKDFQALARIVYLMVYGQNSRKAEPTSSRLESFLQEKANDLNKLREWAYQTVDIFCRISQHPTHGECMEELSSFEFVTANYLIFRERTKLTDSQLSKAILRMRQDYTTQKKKNTKSSTLNFKSMLSFIDKHLSKIIPSIPKLEGEQVASLAPLNRRELSYDQFKDMADKPLQAETNKKRKRTTADDDGDMADSEEDVVTKAKRVVKKSRESLPAPATTSPKKTARVSTSAAKTTVKKTSSSRKSEGSGASSSKTVAVKAPPSAVSQSSAKPSSSGRTLHAQLPTRAHPSSVASSSTQQNFQSGSSQSIVPPPTSASGGSGITRRSASNRLDPLKLARAEIRTNNSPVVQNQPQSQSQTGNQAGGQAQSQVQNQTQNQVSETPSWDNLKNILLPNSTSTARPSAPVVAVAVPVPIPVPVEQPRAAAVGQAVLVDPRAAAPVGQAMDVDPRASGVGQAMAVDSTAGRKDSMGSSLTSMSPSPSPMPGAFAPQYAHRQLEPQQVSSQQQQPQAQFAQPPAPVAQPSSNSQQQRPQAQQQQPQHIQKQQPQPQPQIRQQPQVPQQPPLNAQQTQFLSAQQSQFLNAGQQQPQYVQSVPRAPPPVSQPAQSASRPQQNAQVQPQQASRPQQNAQVQSVQQTSRPQQNVQTQPPQVPQQGQPRRVTNPPRQQQAGPPSFFRSSRVVDPNIARATAEINNGPSACNDLRGTQGRQPPSSIGSAALNLLTPKQIQQQQQP